MVVWERRGTLGAIPKDLKKVLSFEFFGMQNKPMRGKKYVSDVSGVPVSEVQVQLK